MKQESPESLVGKTIRWSFVEGPKRGSSYEHTFNADGSVVYKESGDKGAEIRQETYFVKKIAPNMHVISYLASSGDTLTFVLNFDNMSINSCVSNGKMLSVVKGTFEVLDKS